MRLLRILPCALLPFTVTANPITEEYRLNFIETYSALAVEEMHLSGIPASITLAQAILESNWGQGATAVNANNFFCIKCNNGWIGEGYYLMDDETIESCFRSYGSVLESFKDRTYFLTKNPRYQNLFLNPITDYRSWAYGLKECGYATDELYAQKLIGLVESYSLYVYDYAASPEGQVMNIPTNEEALYYHFPEQGDYEMEDEGFYTDAKSEGPVRPAGSSLLIAPSYELSAQNGQLEMDRFEVEAYNAPARENFSQGSNGGSKIRPINPLPESYR